MGGLQFELNAGIPRGQVPPHVVFMFGFVSCQRVPPVRVLLQQPLPISRGCPSLQHDDDCRKVNHRSGRFLFRMEGHGMEGSNQCSDRLSLRHTRQSRGSVRGIVECTCCAYVQVDI